MKTPVKKRQRILKTILIVVVVLVAVRLALPYVILHYANRTLANMDGYYGHIEDVDLAIIRGAYKIDSIYINKLDSATQKQTPFFGASVIDLSVEWQALFKGEVVGEVIMDRPLLRFTKDKVEPKDVRKDSTDFKKLLDDFMPLSINRFEVNNGSIQYIDHTANPKVDIAMTQTDIVAKNLRNSYDSSVLLPASVYARANVYGGTLELNCKLNPLADIPTFDMNAAVNNTQLVRVNDFFKAYAKADVNKGTFGLYAELAAKEGKFDGYVKPVIKDLDVLGAEDQKDNIFRKLWEGIVGGVGEVFENQPKDRLATKIPLQGTVKQLDTNVWYAIGVVLQNAFIQALQPAIDQEINIATVGNDKNTKKNFLEKTFGGDQENNQEQALSKKETREKRRMERKKKREQKRKERQESKG
jgi:hypothetical protein